MAQWLRQPTGDSDTIGKALARKASVTWVAAGHVTTKAAIEDPNFPIAFNALHPDFGAASPLRCDNIRINATGFKVMSVVATFSIPVNGGEHEPPEPLETNPLVYSWSTVQESVAIDRDLAGNALITSARRGVQGLSQTKNYKRLTITRWEASFAASQAFDYENHVNSDPFQGATAGEVKCAIIQPSGNYTQLSTLIPIDYTFDFKPESIWGEHPWQTQYLDQDSKAWANIDGAKLVTIVDINGYPVGDTPLDGEGRPIDTSLTYMIENPDYEPDNDEPRYIPNPSPSWVSNGKPDGATVVAAGSVKMLRFATIPSVAFSGLGFA